MLSLPGSVHIYLAAEPADMRNGFDGLAAAVVANGLDVFSGHLFVFVSKRRDRAKILAWDRGGFVLWYNQLSSHYTSFDSRSLPWWIAAARSLSRSQRLQCFVGSVGGSS